MSKRYGLWRNVQRDELQILHYIGGWAEEDEKRLLDQYGLEFVLGNLSREEARTWIKLANIKTSVDTMVEDDDATT